MKQTNYLKCGKAVGMLLLGVGLFFALVSPVLAGQLYQFKANEDYAQALLYNDSAKCYIQVSRGSVNNSPQTYLTYWLDDFAAGTYSSGNGVIPDNDLKGNWQTGLTLTTDTSRMTGGQVYGYAGRITVTWTNSPNAASYRVTGARDTMIGNLVTHSNGTSYYGDAVATGTIFYSTFDKVLSGFMGINNQVTVTIEKR